MKLQYNNVILHLMVQREHDCIGSRQGDGQPWMGLLTGVELMKTVRRILSG
jgi:hypothetical protein